MSLCFGFRGFARGKGLLEVLNDIVDVLRPHGYADQIFSDTATSLLLVAQLLMRGRPRVDGQGFGVTNAMPVSVLPLESQQKNHLLCQIRDQFESVHYLAASCLSSLDSERQDTTRSSGEVFLRQLV